MTRNNAIDNQIKLNLVKFNNLQSIVMITDCIVDSIDDSYELVFRFLFFWFKNFDGYFI